MPAVESSFQPAMALRENAGTEKFDSLGQRATDGDDFDRAMKNALSPINRKMVPVKNHSHAEKNSVEPEKFSTTKKSATDSTTDSKSSAKSHHSADKSQRSVAEKDSDNQKTATDYLLDSNAAVGVMDPTKVAPIFLSLPFFGNFAATAEKGKIASADPLTVNPTKTAGTETAEKTSGATEKNSLNLPAANLAPVTSTEAATLNSGLKAAAEKAMATDDKKIDPNCVPAIANEKKDAPENSAALDAKEKMTASLADSIAMPDGKTAENKGNLNSTAIASAAAAAGTGVAPTALSMKNSQKTNKVAGSDVKVLPVGETGAAQASKLPSSVVLPVRAADNRGADLNFAFSNGQGGAAVVDNSPVLNVLDLPSLTDARMRALERTQDMVALHSMRLVESKLDTLSVVIKPSVGMELSLELRQHNGGVEAEATLTRGDHQFLSQHWPELQQRLEQRGIRLAALGGDTGFAPSDNSFQRQQTSQEDAAQQASAFAEFASTRSSSSIGGATARLAVVHEGWESWA